MGGGPIAFLDASWRAPAVAAARNTQHLLRDLQVRNATHRRRSMKRIILTEMHSAPRALCVCSMPAPWFFEGGRRIYSARAKRMQ